jgi:hypothetical protein
MTSMVLRFLLACCGGLFVCVLAGVGVVYMAWVMAQRDNGWQQ